MWRSESTQGTLYGQHDYEHSDRRHNEPSTRKIVMPSRVFAEDVEIRVEWQHGAASTGICPKGSPESKL